jgi:hypothetical protein
MRYIITLLLSIAGLQVIAQMDLPASGGNPRAKITEEVGITDITISYSRPDVNGREGKIWGPLVTPGFTGNNLNTNRNTTPWRAGANETTTISFEHDVKFEGKPVKAGTYGLFMAMYVPDSVIIILSTQANAWGSFYYDEKDDVVRVKVKPVVLDKSVEYLKYEFVEHKEKHCVVAMQWEKVSVPFKIEVDVENIVLARLREQVNGQKGFNNLNLITAANYLANKNIYLEDALAWSQRAAGLKSFTTLNVLGNVYTKMNRLREADSVMTEALTFANANQYLVYGRALIAAKRADRAIEIVSANEKRFGNVYPVNAGYMYGYSAKGDFKKALEYAQKALAQAPNEAVKTTINGLITKLNEGKDIN